MYMNEETDELEAEYLTPEQRERMNRLAQYGSGTVAQSKSNEQPFEKPFEQPFDRVQKRVLVRQEREKFNAEQTMRVQFRERELQQLMILLEKDFEDNIRNKRSYEPYKRVLNRRLRKKVGRALAKIRGMAERKFPYPE